VRGLLLQHVLLVPLSLSFSRPFNYVNSHSFPSLSPQPSTSLAYRPSATDVWPISHIPFGSSVPTRRALWEMVSIYVQIVFVVGRNSASTNEVTRIESR
jgi:hypothetical protein